jgi:hypothetical protein
MRAFSLLGFCCVALVFAGCESLSQRVTQRFTPAEPQVRDLAQEQGAVFQAAVHALKKIDFVTTRTGQAQGVIQAHGRLLPTDDFGAYRQYVFKIRVLQLEPSVTRVSVVLQRDTEDRAGGTASSEEIPAHGLYESFFASLQAEAGVPAIDPATRAQPPTETGGE